ncbi:MAG: DUF3793 family protein [Ruminococcus sp.]|nr:DUF3793 family protein [Ruminococcus sp.]
MSEDTIIRNCSPTLAGIKTGSLFNCPYTTVEETECYIKRFNKSFAQKGVVLKSLNYSKGRVLAYMYRPSMLKSDLSNSCAGSILRKNGYQSSKVGYCITRLTERISGEGEFPHEIGLFLGYPPEDVQGFISNKGCSAKCTGCWKVYGNKKTAERQFAKIKKCTSVYCKKWSQGTPLHKLTVSAKVY